MANHIEKFYHFFLLLNLLECMFSLVIMRKARIFYEERLQEEIASYDPEKGKKVIEQTEIPFTTVDDPPKYEDVAEIVWT